MGFRKILALIVCCCLSCVVLAQESYFAQQYANRLHLNPAFAGLDRSWSVSLAHRNQWPALNGSFIANQLTADYRFTDTKSAIGLLLQQDRAGIGGLQKLQATLGYAYHTNLTSTWAMSAGLQASLGSLRLNFDNLVFGDQLSDNGQVALTSAEAGKFAPSRYVTFTAGGLLYATQFWAGLTAANLNKPTFGFGQKTTLPLRFTAIAGYKFYAKSYQQQGKLFELSFTPTLTYVHQQPFRRMDVGLYTIYTPLTFGLVYKGVPLTGDPKQDQTVSVIAGLQLEQFKLGYSHDVGITGLSRQLGGANEISLVFEQLTSNKLFRSRSARKISRNIACPAF